jgi:HK97 family phage major capsid protein
MSFAEAKDALVKAQQTPPGKGRPQYTVKLNPGTMAVAKNVPHVTTGPVCQDSQGYSVLKAAAYSLGLIPEDQCKEELAISKRLEKVYGNLCPFFQGGNRAMLVPASPAFFPMRLGSGQDIHGANEIQSECAERMVKGVEGFDPEKAAWIARKTGHTTKALSTLSEIAGGSMVPPPVLGDMIDLQRTMEAFASAGATNVTLPPSGRMSFPKLTAGATAYWVGETQSVTESQQSTGALNLEAKKAAVRVPTTNELLKFADGNTEAMIRTDMARVGARLIDLAQLQGTGGTQIKGIITYESQTSWTPNTDKVIKPTPLQSPAPDANTGYLFQPEDVYKMESALPDGVELTAWIGRKDFWGAVLNRRNDAVSAGDSKGAFTFDGFRGQALGPQPSLAGGKLVRSAQVANTRTRGTATDLTYVLAGFFPDWLIGRMGIFEFVVDPYTQLQNWQTVIQAIQYCDAGPRHPASFVWEDAFRIA